MTPEEKTALNKAKTLLIDSRYTGQAKVIDRIYLILEYTDTPKAYKKAQELQHKPHKEINCPYCKNTKVLKIRRWLNKEKKQ